MNRSLFLLFLAGVGCATQTQFEPYYENWNPPSVSSLSVTSEVGNIGGGTVDISGRGFGEDVDQIVVQFGDDNAEILAIEDGLIQVRVPQGPITGGAVEVRVATRTGFTIAGDSYLYDVGDLYAEQIGHIQVNNYWESCLGGNSERIDDAYGTTGCQDAVYIGAVGIDGVAEALTFVYPRLHSENVGFFGGTDQAGSEWVIQRPGQNSFAFGVEDLHQDIGEVVLENDDVWDGYAWCPDLDAQASYRYGGGEEGYIAPVNVSQGGIVDGTNCELGDEGAYDVSDMRFCTTPGDDGAPTYVYRPDWPIPKNFFAGKRNDYTKPATIVIRAPEVGIDGLEVDVPESVVVYNEQGFEPVVDGETAAQDLWSISGLQGCYDDNGDGESLDDVALSFAWDRSTVSENDGTFECDAAGDLCAQNTYVRLTLTSLSLNWFGTVGYPVRATIVASDRSGRDDRQTLEVPASVMYQFPSVRLPAGGGVGGETFLLDSTISDWGYVVVTFERVTDYAIRTDKGGTVVFSYTTGDFGFFGWDNPTDADECHNCLDDDGDGWSDVEDPDCAGGGTEEVGFGEDACNDNVDNDGDGRRDSLDSLCESGSGSDESNCSNSEDDDGDDLVDELDPDCLAGGNEGDTTGVDTCTDELDGDEDGWIDLEDPDCLSGDAEVGLGLTACNDGVDNDGDELIDSLDGDCSAAEDDDESPPPVPGCSDGLDGDVDGWTDASDPDCASGTEEVGFGLTACNDGRDNDKDELIDALDLLDCVDALDDDESSVSELP